MPKIQKDVELHQEVQQFVIKMGGIPQAAIQLGIDRTTLWRFNKSGCAIDRTRHALSDAIKRNKSATTEFAAHETRTKLDAPISISCNDLKTMRSFCQSMMALIDVYEQQLAEKSPDIDAPGHGTTSVDVAEKNAVSDRRV